MVSPFDIVKHISEKTEFEFDMKEYNPWVINKALSNNIDTLFFAAAMNGMSFLDPDIQYSFYFHGIPKAKRYGKWNKTPDINSTVELIMEHFQVNRRHAETYLKMMNQEAIDELIKITKTGGIKNA